MRAAAFALAALLAVVPAAAQAEEEPPVTDPVGDARWYGTQDAYAAATVACDAAGAPGARACGAAPAPPDAARTPAPPVLDVVHARFHEEGENLVVELAVASLSLDFAGTGFSDEILSYGVCWVAEAGDPCVTGVYLDVWRVGAWINLDEWLLRLDAECEATGACSYNVPIEIVPGSPGLLRWTVPRAALFEGAPAGTVLKAPVAFASHAWMPPGGPAFTWRIDGGEARGDGFFGADATSTADVAGPGRDVVLAQPVAPRDVERDRDADWIDPAGDGPGGRADLDVLRLEFSETERTFTAALEVARVDEVPVDHHWYFSMGVTTGTAVVAGFEAEGGVRTEYSGVCDEDCGPFPPRRLSKPAEIDVTPGEPGWINVTFARSDLGNPYRGDGPAWMYAGLLEPSAVTSYDAHGARVTRVVNGYGDHVWDPQPWWFVLGDERPTDEDGGTLVEDPLDDVETGPEGLVGANADAFDVTAIRALGVAPGFAKVELGIRDLSTVAVPIGYQAVFYAVAFQTERGTSMVGYFDDREKREFFCAPDTTVFVEPRGNPASVIWQPIEGLLSIARDRTDPAAGGSGSGTIVFFAPYSCFGAEGTGDIRADAVAGGAYLVRDLTGRRAEVVALDEARSEGAVVVRAAAPPAPPALAWYVAPFGIENFWDITGILAAAAISGAGLLVVRHKRGALKRYLHEIDEAERAHAGDARAREAALLGIQGRLKADLLRGRIVESHFVIVERRLDHHLGRSRTDALAAAFGDLPHRLLLRLQDLLRDGVMDAEDWRLFRSQLDAEAHLTPHAREAIVRRLEAWVREE